MCRLVDDLGEFVKLTVIHDGFEPGSEVLETISQGWPHTLSNLKTLLETGHALTENQLQPPTSKLRPDDGAGVQAPSPDAGRRG
jgi:hypothetical protein